MQSDLFEQDRLKELEARLWEVADELRANSKLKSSDYSVPVLGLIFLRFAEARFVQAKDELEEEQPESSRRSIGKDDYKEKGVLYLPEEARYSNLLALPDSANLGGNVDDAMKAIMRENEELSGVLPASEYREFDDRVLNTLLKKFNEIPLDIEGDAFGQIYEYFLSQFAKAEGRRGGEFFTPTSIVRLIVDVIEPFHGRILDPACGSGGMFVQSARFVERHNGEAPDEITIFGQERVEETVNLCKMNLAVHGLDGTVRQGNSYYEDPRDLPDRTDAFEFVMANPPFNVDSVDKSRLKNQTDERFPFGMPSVDNANYIWAQLFYSALSDDGRAGFVMANSAADARGSERDIRKKLVESGAVDVMIAVGQNFFYTVSLPCTLWFYDRGAVGTEREDTVLFIDARDIYTEVDRALNKFTPEQIEFIANIARLYRGEPAETAADSDDLMAEHFPDAEYEDVPGLCKVATREEIAEQDYSLNPGRYVGIEARPEHEDFDFQARLTELNEELEQLNAEAHELEAQIAENVDAILKNEVVVNENE
jgi:type I restriction enzyme M protein